MVTPDALVGDSYPTPDWRSLLHGALMLGLFLVAQFAAVALPLVIYGIVRDFRDRRIRREMASHKASVFRAQGKP